MTKRRTPEQRHELDVAERLDDLDATIAQLRHQSELLHPRGVRGCIGKTRGIHSAVEQSAFVIRVNRPGPSTLEGRWIPLVFPMHTYLRQAKVSSADLRST